MQQYEMLPMYHEIIITKYADIKEAIFKILEEYDSSTEYILRRITLEDTLFKIKGGRFDEQLIPASTVNLIVNYKTDMKHYFMHALHIEIQDELLYFNADRGSFNFNYNINLNEILEKLVNKMSPTQLTFIILVIAGIWFASSSFDSWLSYSEREMLKQYDHEEKMKLIELIEKIQKDKILKFRKNKTPNNALNMLNEDEYLIYGNKGSNHKYTQNDKDNFDYEPIDDIQYFDIVDYFNVKAAAEKNGKIVFKLKPVNRIHKPYIGKNVFEAESKLENNDLLYDALDHKKTLKLKVAIGFNNDIKKVMEADIFEVVK